MWEILSLHVTSHELELARPSTSTPRSGQSLPLPLGGEDKGEGQPAEQLLTNSQLREVGQVYVALATRICPGRGWAQSRTEGRGGSSRTSRKAAPVAKTGRPDIPTRFETSTGIAAIHVVLNHVGNSIYPYTFQEPELARPSSSTPLT